MMYSPASAALNEVPQPVKIKFSHCRNSSGRRSMPLKRAVASSAINRPRITSRNVSGCSWISFCMKCSKFPFDPASAVISMERTMTGAAALPSIFETSNDSPSSQAISPSFK